MHANIIKYCKRPFSDIGEMDKKIIENWNSVVKDEDLIFCLGDFALGKEQDCLKILKKLNGHKVLIKGNHEKTVLKKSYNIDEFRGGIYERLDIRVMNQEVSDEFQDLVLSPNQFDVGVDSHNFTPISYERVKEIITLRNLKKIKGNG